MVDIRSFNSSDLVIIRMSLYDSTPRNFKEMSAATGLGYNTCREKMTDLENMGLLIKVRGGRYVQNKLYGVCNLFKEIFDYADYIQQPPPPKNDGKFHLPVEKEVGEYSVIDV